MTYTLRSNTHSSDAVVVLVWPRSRSRKPLGRYESLVGSNPIHGVNWCGGRIRLRRCFAKAVPLRVLGSNPSYTVYRSYKLSLGYGGFTVTLPNKHRQDTRTVRRLPVRSDRMWLSDRTPEFCTPLREELSCPHTHSGLKPNPQRRNP